MAKQQSPPDLDAWIAAGNAFDFHGRSIFFRDAGQGDAVLCIHGFPTASWDWCRVWPDLVAAHRVVAFDLLGFGRSAKPRPHAYSVLEQADIATALLERLGLGRVHLLAHDLGASVAQELLARHVDGRGVALRSVCFLNGGLFPETHRPRLIQTLLLSPLSPLLARRLDARRFARSFAAVFGAQTQPTADELAALWRLVSHERGHELAPALLRYIPERRQQRERWVGAMQRARVPLRLIVGMADPVSGAHMARRYRELVPQADVVELPGIGHYPQLEAPQAVIAGWKGLVERARDAEPLAPRSGERGWGEGRF